MIGNEKPPKYDGFSSGSCRFSSPGIWFVIFFRSYIVSAPVVSIGFVSCLSSKRCGAAADANSARLSERTDSCRGRLTRPEQCTSALRADRRSAPVGGSILFTRALSARLSLCVYSRRPWLQPACIAHLSVIHRTRRLFDAAFEVRLRKQATCSQKMSCSGRQRDAGMGFALLMTTMCWQSLGTLAHYDYGWC